MTQTLLEQWMQKGAQSVQGASANDSPQTTTDAYTKVEDAIVSPSQSSRLQKVSFRHPKKDDIPTFKRLNSLILPIPYPESFYKEIVADEVANSLTLLAFWNDTASTTQRGQLVGAIRCRLLNDKSSTIPLLYISTLVVLSPYRSLGIASSLLNMMIRRGFEDYGTTKIGAHVWVANTTGLEWYAKRGFTETAYEEDYYRRLEPHGAKVLSKMISALDVTGD